MVEEGEFIVGWLIGWFWGVRKSVELFRGVWFIYLLSLERVFQIGIRVDGLMNLSDRSDIMVCWDACWL